MLIGTSISTGCQSSDAKIKETKASVKESNEDLTEAQNNTNEEVLKLLEDKEWKKIKNEEEAKIEENEIRIAELRKKMKSSGKV